MHRACRTQTSQRHAGEFKPPEDTGKPAGAAGKAPSAAGRVASFIGNTLFYGTLLGGAAFVGSTYAVTDEEVKRRRDAADAARGEGPLAEAAAVATGYFAEAREWYAEKVKGFTGALRCHIVLPSRAHTCPPASTSDNYEATVP